MIWTLKVELLFGTYAEEEWDGLIELESSSTLEELHFSIIDAVNFENDHLYEFYVSRTERTGLTAGNLIVVKSWWVTWGRRSLAMGLGDGRGWGYGPLRHPKAPGLSLTGVRLVFLHHAKGRPSMLRAFSLCTCCRHYPGTGTENTALLTPPALSAFPTWVGGSACATSFSRIAQRSLALRPAHSLDHLK
jgi:hypothetical protein